MPLIILEVSDFQAFAKVRKIKVKKEQKTFGWYLNLVVFLHPLRTR